MQHPMANLTCRPTPPSQYQQKRYRHYTPICSSCRSATQLNTLSQTSNENERSPHTQSNLARWLRQRNRLFGLVVRASASRAEDPGFESRLRRDFPGSSHTSDFKIILALQWLPCQAPGVIGPVRGLVGPVSVYCDWVRWKVWICNFYLSVATAKIV